VESEKGHKGFRDLIAWQKADELASLVYRACKELPARDRWLIDQILRSAISVPANIAEGHGRGSRAQLLQFIDIARGSLSELEYYIHFLSSEGLLPSDKTAELEASRLKTGRVLFGLWRSLKAMNNADWDHTGTRVSDEHGIYVVN
jgi:four helix bundle protein